MEIGDSSSSGALTGTVGTIRANRTTSSLVLRVLAVLLSLVAPGCGHFLVGRFVRGAAWLLGLELLTTALYVTMPFTLWVIAPLLAIVVCGRIAAAIDVARIAPLHHSWRVLLVAWTALLAGAGLLESGFRAVAVHYVQAFRLPTPSMEPTLLADDHILADMHVYRSWPIQRGDLIVFKYPKDLTRVYVKRAIGLPGDHIKIVDKQVFINNVPLAEPYKIHLSPPGSYADPFRDFFPPKPRAGRIPRDTDDDPYWYEEFEKNGEIVIPTDHFFVLGDNRDNSADSRYWGFVPRDIVMGKAFVIYWSFDSDAQRPRWNRILRRIE